MTDDATPAALPDWLAAWAPPAAAPAPVYPQPLTTPEPNAIALTSFAVEDERGAPADLLTQFSQRDPLFVRGALADGTAVRSGALVRWYVDFAAEPPSLLLQSTSTTYALPADEAAAAHAYRSQWAEAVACVALSARVLQAARAGADEVWSEADIADEDALRRRWPFVKAQLRALGENGVRPPWSRAGRGEEPEKKVTRLSGGKRAGPPQGFWSNPSRVGGGVASRSKAPRVEELTPFEPELRPGETLEVQAKRCRAPRYGSLPRCVSCVKNRNSEGCRFRFMRRLAVRDGVVVRSLGDFEPGTGYRLNTSGSGAGGGTRRQAAYILGELASVCGELIEDEMSATAGEPVVVVDATSRGTHPRADGYAAEDLSLIHI